jgi:hypothetical protein
MQKFCWRSPHCEESGRSSFLISSSVIIRLPINYFVHLNLVSVTYFLNNTNIGQLLRFVIEPICGVVSNSNFLGELVWRHPQVIHQNLDPVSQRHCFVQPLITSFSCNNFISSITHGLRNFQSVCNTLNERLIKSFATKASAVKFPRLISTGYSQLACNKQEYTNYDLTNSSNSISRATPRPP